MYLTIERKPKPKPQYIECKWFSDLTSIAVKKQHKLRWFKMDKGKYFKCYAIVLYNKQTKNGFFSFIPNNPKPKQVLRFFEKLDFRETFKRDKGFHYKYLKNGIPEQGYRDKQIIEHLFGFKVAIYKKFAKGEIKNVKELLDLYRYYFNRLELKEVFLY